MERLDVLACELLTEQYARDLNTRNIYSAYGLVASGPRTSSLLRHAMQFCIKRLLI